VSATPSGIGATGRDVQLFSSAGVFEVQTMERAEVISRAKRRLVVAKVIKFYIPANFRKRKKWVPIERRGQVIEFYLRIKKPA
jgi:hypothetical protein